MGRFETLNAIWPPVGWPQLAAVKSSSAQALAKDIGKARIYGLQYRIDSIPLFKNETRFFRHDIRIDGWEYSILNESCEYPILSLSLLDRFDLNLSPECFVADVRSYDTMMPHTRRSTAKAVSAAVFLMRQIEEGNVPDINRVLRVYKLHPNQAFLYRADQSLERDLKMAFESGLIGLSQTKVV